jgi:hypothetical protein
MKEKFAVIGWGSLINDPGCLKIESDIWKEDGPRLPIEFARKSSDERITLVLYPPYLKDKEKWVTTYWNLLNVNTVDEAREDLRKRERCPSLKSIGYLYKGKIYCKNVKIGNIIKSWAITMGISGVVWTDLGSNISLKKVIPHLSLLKNEKYLEAKDYILDGPKQTNTPLRPILEKYVSNREI